MNFSLAAYRFIVVTYKTLKKILKYYVLLLLKWKIVLFDLFIFLGLLGRRMFDVLRMDRMCRQRRQSLLRLGLSRKSDKYSTIRRKEA